MVSSRSTSNTLNLPGKIQCFRISSKPAQKLPESLLPLSSLSFLSRNISLWSPAPPNSPTNAHFLYYLPCSNSFPQAKITPAHPLPVAKNTPKISVKQPWKTSSSAASNFYLPPLWFFPSNTPLSNRKDTPISCHSYLFLFFSSVTAFIFLPDLPLQPALQQQPTFLFQALSLHYSAAFPKHSSNGQTTFTGVNPWLLLQATNLIPHQPTMHGHVAPWDCDTWQNQAAENEPPNGGLQLVWGFMSSILRKWFMVWLHCKNNMEQWQIIS